MKAKLLIKMNFGKLPRQANKKLKVSSTLKSDKNIVGQERLVYQTS